MSNIRSRIVDSDLGCWSLAEWSPPAGTPLARDVVGIWDFEGRITTPRERVFPNGGVEIILQLDDPYRDVGAGDPAPATCVTGVHTGAFVIEAPPRPCRVIGIRLHPPAAWALLGHPMSELADRTTDLELVLGRDVAELAERCHGLRSGSERVRRVVGWLGGRLAEGRTPAVDPAVLHVTHAIARTAGRTSIEPLRQATGLSSAGLADRFRRQVGVTPKRYARIHRFRWALGLLGEPEPDLATVARSAGYYDQPHMNADFRRMAGLTPGAYVRSRRFPSSPHLAETGSP
ncbi:MAG: helix-turn-helix domain-containing protein [Gemmatimonadota bacterium]